MIMKDFYRCLIQCKRANTLGRNDGKLSRRYSKIICPHWHFMYGQIGNVIHHHDLIVIAVFINESIRYLRAISFLQTDKSTNRILFVGCRCRASKIPLRLALHLVIIIIFVSAKLLVITTVMSFPILQLQFEAIPEVFRSIILTQRLLKYAYQISSHNYWRLVPILS